MKSNREFENRAAIIVALRAGRSPKEIVDFLKLPKTTIYRVKKQFDEADSNKEGIATRKKHSRRSDRVRGEEFVKNVKEKIDGNPGKSMRAIAKEMDVGSMTIVRTIHEDLGLKSYALRKGQLLTENMKNNRKGKAAALLNNLKHDSFGMLRFFSDEKNFDVDQKVNPRNDRWICKDPSEIPVVMHTKFPASVMVLGVISSEGDVMPPHFFEKGLRMNADTYINVLETVVKPWMDMVAAGRKYVFQQDSAPAHKAKKTQSWLTLNVPSHWGPDIWPPNSPDCNPLDYYRDVNKAPHTTIQSVKKAVHTVMTQMDKVIVAKACASFRTRLETVVKLDEILSLADSKGANIICLQETKLKPNHLFKVKGFKILRKDRPSANGGGGLLTLIKDLSFEEIDTPSTTHTELQAFKIHLPNQRPLTITLLRATTPSSSEITITLLQKLSLRPTKSNRISGLNSALQLTQKPTTQNYEDLLHALNQDTPSPSSSNTFKDNSGNPLTNHFAHHYSSTAKLNFNLQNKIIGRKSRVTRNLAKFKPSHNIFSKPFQEHELDEALTPGPDNITGPMLKNLSSHAKLELLSIFNYSWSSSTLPKEWKHATIIPIHKPGKLENHPTNYRPISLTSIP
ncbi:hypothetical protein LAZ67_2002819 [Cordylochernes scorpioides]|uniref:Transposase n=1 Tax=Cordylochernes scorpioides TaxID=51811 RepID=A0ABY6K2I4_9ARAC|nr:hypothetical protein LAZ67_2002819 [Cordylochernes scorpioides]